MGIKRRRCAVIARTRPGLHRPLSGCSWARAVGLEGPFRALSLGAIAGHQSSGGFVCALTVLHVLVSSVVFLQGVLLAGTLQRDIGTDAEFYHLVGITRTDSLKWLKNRIIFKYNIISQQFSL